MTNDTIADRCSVPEEMSGCIRLSGEELTSLKSLLDKMMLIMEETK